MAEQRSTRRFLGLLRRAAKGSRGSGRAPADDGVIWVSHEQALARTRDASDGAQRIASNAARQRTAAEALSDRAHAVAARAQELGNSFGRITDTFERLGLVALNAGLEGARLGDNGGRAMLLVSDEVRAHVARGSESARELSSALTEVGAELAKLHVHIDQAREASADAAQEAARVAAATAEAEQALGEIGDRLKRATGSDPETAKAVAEAAEHARALVAALGKLSGKVPRALLLGVLRPMLDPLARVLAEEEPAGDEEARG